MRSVERRRRRALLALVGLLAACGGTKAAVPTTSIAFTTTSTTSTTSATVTPSTTSATTTTVATNADWTPPCVPFAGGPTPSPGPYTEAALDTFGPLPASPSLTITVPTGITLGNDPPNPPPRVQPARVEGGVLLALSASSMSVSKSSILAVVNTDGSKRWVRCIPGQISSLFVAPPSTRPTTATLAVVENVTATESTSDWPIVSLTDGTITGSLGDAASSAGINRGDFSHYWVASTDPGPPTKVMLTHAPIYGDTEHVDHLLSYDVTTKTMAAIPIPPELLDLSSGATLGFSTGGDPVLSDHIAVGGYERVLAVYRDGAWSRDQAAISRTFGTRVFIEVDAPFSIVGLAADGTVVWRDANLTSPQLQGMSVDTDGGITVATVCTDEPANPPCTYALVGVDSATGKLRWSLPGLRLVAAFSNGYILTNDGSIVYSDDGNATPGWVLLNAATGTLVDASQHWTDPDAFRNGCCGESENVWVSRAGGVLFAINNTKVNVWYPMAVAGPTHTLSIP